MAHLFLSVRTQLDSKSRGAASTGTAGIELPGETERFYFGGRGK
jgi:hypothetical protein